MTLHVIGAGVGRTGTYSLKLAIDQLGLGRCHHMEEVILNMPAQVPHWAAAVSGHPDWEAIYKGYESAVDWPTAGFFRELHSAYPSAKFVLTLRNPESWAESFSETIYKLVAGRDHAHGDARLARYGHQRYRQDRLSPRPRQGWTDEGVHRAY